LEVTFETEKYILSEFFAVADAKIIRIRHTSAKKMFYTD
jgi:hypothetical protein